jgi:hypothetical protein
MLIGMICAHKPWFGPELIWFQLATGDAFGFAGGQVTPCGVTA